MEQNKYVQWLLDNRRLFNIRMIEEALKMPEGTLNKFTKKERPLAEKWHKPVEKYLKKLAQKIEALDQ